MSWALLQSQLQNIISMQKDMELYEVSQKLQMRLEEIEYIFLRMNDYEPTDVHPDNIVAGKAPPYRL
jgi:hypothetical protein